MNEPKRLDIMKELAWKKQAIKECVEWVKAQETLHSNDEMIAFEAGIRKGWNECVKTLKIQGIIK